MENTAQPNRVPDLSPTEFLMVSELLSLAAGAYEGHSSNDYFLPATATCRQIAAAAIDMKHREFGNDGGLEGVLENDGKLFIYDDWLMSYFADRWERLGKTMRTRDDLAAAPLSKEELEVVAGLLNELAANEFGEFTSETDDEDYAIPATEENKDIVVAAIKNSGCKDPLVRMKKVFLAQDQVATYTIWLLSHLARRCESLAAHSSAIGLSAVLPEPWRAELPPVGSPAASGVKKIERPGISPRWLGHWKTNCRTIRAIGDESLPDEIRELEHYAQQGRTLREEKHPREVVVNPPFLSWEIYLEVPFSMLATSHLNELEVSGIKGNPFDTTLALSSFAANYTCRMIELRSLIRFPVRFPGRTAQSGLPPSLEKIPYTALGMVIGCRKEAFRLARLQLAAHRKEYFSKAQEFYAGSHFILRLLADYLDEAPLVLRGEALSHPIYNALMEIWRQPDADALVHACLAACDEHTHRVVPNKKSGEFCEFGQWMRTPVEILLLFKLRQLLGLSNPKLDHPIMNTPLGVLPPEVSFVPEDLIKRVRDRMMMDGYDEEAIVADYRL
jgi:hypothetical protein